MKKSFPCGLMGNCRMNKTILHLQQVFNAVIQDKLQPRETGVKSEGKDFSIIDSNLSVTGNLYGRGTLMVKGDIQGTVEGETIVIAKEGTVKAVMKATSVTVGGKFEGELSADKELIVLSTGNCSGKVACGDIVVEIGGILNAEISCNATGSSDKKRWPFTKETAG